MLTLSAPRTPATWSLSTFQTISKTYHISRETCHLNFRSQTCGWCIILYCNLQQELLENFAPSYFLELGKSCVIVEVCAVTAKLVDTIRIRVLEGKIYFFVHQILWRQVIHIYGRYERILRHFGVQGSAQNMWDESYVYWTVHHLDSWIKRDQLDVTCVIISLFNAQHISDVNTSILRSLRLIWWVISWVVLFWFDVCWCYVVVWLGWCGIRM